MQETEKMPETRNEVKAKKPKNTRKSKAEKLLEKDLAKILIFLAFLVILFLVVSAVFKSFNKFEYNGLTFTKEKFGEIPVFHYYYYFEDPATEKLIQYNLFLRNDPRYNNVSIYGEGGIDLPLTKEVSITVDGSELTRCSKSAAAVATLSGFLTDNQFLVRAGTNDYIESTLYNLPYITCENKWHSPVISIQEGQETKIQYEGNCYMIDIGPECNIIEAVERFELQTILDARARSLG